MSEKYILYNPCAGGPETEKAVKALQDANEGAVAINICRIISYKTFFNGLDPNDTVILCGGDGTLNRFVNDVNGISSTTTPREPATILRGMSGKNRFRIQRFASTHILNGYLV